MGTTHRLRETVDAWLVDVQRRGAELYAWNEGNGVQYLSFEGRGGIRYSLELDYTLGEIILETEHPKLSGVTREYIGFTPENLRALARRMAPLAEGQACIPANLLSRLVIICQAYRRLVADFDKAKRIHTSTETVRAIEADLVQFADPQNAAATTAPPALQRGNRPG